MFDCNLDIKAFHNGEVTLPQQEQDRMRNRRDSNRDRLKRNLEKDEKPLPYEFVSQGSYRMKTMIRDEQKDYDIDDGAYFHATNLVGSRGGEMSSVDARNMVCSAMDDGQFKTPPEVKNNCVRIHYKAGYHVDIPIYRRVVDDESDEEFYELASSEGWLRSDARDVTAWYEEVRSGTSDPKQFLRLNRLLKKFAKSRESWKSQTLSGFGITALLAEQAVLRSNRDDVALYETMVSMRNRLKVTTVIDHPVTLGQTITKGNPDAKARFFCDKLTDAITLLERLFNHDCDHETACECWDKAFYTTFFSDRFEDENESKSQNTRQSVSSTAIVTTTSISGGAIRSEGSGRYA